MKMNVNSIIQVLYLACCRNADSLAFILSTYKQFIFFFKEDKQVPEFYLSYWLAKLTDRKLQIRCISIYLKNKECVLYVKA